MADGRIAAGPGTILRRAPPIGALAARGTSMTRKFIPGLIVAALVAGCLSAQAMPAGDADLMRNYAVSGLAHEGDYVADFVQGRLVTAAPRVAALTMAGADADRAARYASESAMLTIVFLAVAGALASLAVLRG